MRRAFWFLLVLSLAPSGIGLYGQSTSQEIAGFVRDSTGATVPNVSVSARSTATGLTRSATSNEGGYYVISNLPIGDYEISAEATGFKKFIKTNVILTVNAKLTVDVNLELGALAQSITVAAEAAQIESSNGDVGRLVTGEQATELQLNGRNFAQLLALLPGVSTTYRSSFELFGGFGSNMSSQSVNGGRTDTFSWNIDGADNKDNGGGGNNFVNLNPDALAEFKVLTSNYSAEYGQNSGAMVNLALKGGAKNFHGAAYEYVRNDAFDARPFNALSTRKLRFNNFGWNLGGPIYVPHRFNSGKSKLFFFVGEEFKRLRQGDFFTRNVPPLAIRNGDFSSLPVTNWPKDPVTKVPFSVIPAQLINPNSKRLLDNYPKPNFAGAGGNFVFQTVNPLETNQYIYKVDYNLSSRHQISVHYLRDYYTSVQNLTQLITYDRNIPGTNAKVQWTFVMNTSTVNTFQFNLTGNVIHQTNFKPNPIFISDFTRKGEGITYPMIFGNAVEIPTLEVSGYSTLDAHARNWNNFNRIFQWKDDLSKVIRNHNLKVGVLVMRSRKNQDNVPDVNGRFNFSTNHTGSTGNSVADTLLGNFNTYTEASGNREGWFRFSQVEPYVQDDWKASSRLSLNLGLRYQYMQPQYSALQNTVLFLPQFYDPAKAVRIRPKTAEIIPGSGDPYNGLALGGNGFPDSAKERISLSSDPAVQALFRGLPKETAYTDWATFAPRFGFAYDLTGRQKTVLRGGYGVFYERIEGNFIFSAVNNPPFVQQPTIFDGNVENPRGGIDQLTPSSIGNSHSLDMKVPRVQNWSLGIQHKLMKNTMLDMAYVGSSGANLSRGLNLNQLPVGTVQRNPGVNINALRPYPGYANITSYVTGSNSTYHSLQVQFKKQMARGGLLNVAYTWSKAITDASGWSETPMDSYNFKRDRGLASFDRRHVFVFSYIYPLPFWQDQDRWYEKVLGGWQLSGVTTLESGRPLNISVPGDPAGIGGGGQRSNLVGDWHVLTHTSAKWFDTSAFKVADPGTLGNFGRNVVIGPGMNNWDASLQKWFRVGERVKLQFRAEFFDAPNHLSFWDVGTTVTSNNFGQVTSATDPRILQFAIRLTF